MLNSILLIVISLVNLSVLLTVPRILATNINSNGLYGQPCLIPLPNVKNSENLPLSVMQLSMPVYKIATNDKIVVQN